MLLAYPSASACALAPLSMRGSLPPAKSVRALPKPTAASPKDSLSASAAGRKQFMVFSRVVPFKYRLDLQEAIPLKDDKPKFPDDMGPKRDKDDMDPKRDKDDVGRAGDATSGFFDDVWKNLPKIVSGNTYFEDGDVSFSLIGLKGTEESVRALAGPGALVEEVFPTCLIEPVTQEAAGTGIPAEEQQAHVTWGVEAVRAPLTNLTGAGVKVAVLDTGLDKGYQKHPAFKGINVKAKNFTTDNVDDWHDRRGHGTHCLGTILGRPVDGMRIGVAPGVTDVLVAKVIPDSGKGDSLMLADGIMWAWEQGAQVINISLAYDLPAKAAKLKSSAAVKTDEQAYDTVEQICLGHRAFFEGLLQAVRKGDAVGRPPPVIIAAAGNGSTASRKVHVQLPAALDGIVSVAAVKKSPEGFEPAAFSNTGASICAPGVQVWSAAAFTRSSTSQPLLRVESGTSMAAPHVAGVAALWWQYTRDVKHRRGRVAEYVSSKLLGLAADVGFVPGVDEELVGKGLVQAPEAVGT